MNNQNYHLLRNIKALSSASLSVLLCFAIIVTTLFYPLNAQASSGEWTNGNGWGYQLRISYAESEQNAKTNTSKVTATLYLEQDIAHSLYISPRSATITIDGVTKTISNIPVIGNNGNATTKLGTASTVVHHDADGSKSVTISATFNVRAPINHGDYCENMTASKTVALDVLDRSAPTVTVTSVPASLTNTACDLTATSNVACSEWQYSIDNGASWIAFGSAGTTNTLQLRNLTRSTAYTVIVRAKKSSNNVWSSNSNAVSFATVSGPSGSEVQVVSNITSTSAKLNWNGTAASPPYRLYYWTTDDIMDEVLACSGIMGTEYTFSGLVPNTQYKFKATGKYASSAYSGRYVTKPANPTNLSVSEQTDSSVHLSWNYSAGGNAIATAFQIYRDGNLIGSTSNTEYIDDTYQNTSSMYTVSAVTSAGSSAVSNAVNVTQLPLSISLNAENHSTYATVTPTFAGGVQNAVDETSLKWAFGEHNCQYFEENGTKFLQDFAAVQNGTYTVSAEDMDGNGSVQTILVSGIVTANTTGAYTDTFSDLFLEAPGLSVSIDRTYCSIPSTANGANVFGNGWSLNYAKTTYTTTDANNQTVQVVCLPDETAAYFRLENNAYTGIHTQSKLTASNNTFTLTTEDRLQYTYTNGYLTSIEDPNGNTLTIALNEHHLPTTITDSVNRTFSITYNEDQRITAVTDPVGRVSQYVYDANGNLVQTKNNQSVSENYEYTNGLLSAIKDGQDQTISEFAYNDRHQLVQLTEEDEAFYYGYAITNAGETVVYQSSEEFDLDMLDDRNNPEYTVYSVYGEVLIDSEGQMYTYNPDGSLYGISNVNSLIKHVIYQYDSFGNVTRVITRTTSNWLTDDYQILENYSVNRTYFANTDIPETEIETTVENTYDDEGVLSGSKTTTVTTTFDIHGNLLSQHTVVGSDETTRAYTYNAKGLPLSETEDNHRTDYTYDAYGYATSIIKSVIEQNGGNPVTTVQSQVAYTYNKVGQILTQTENQATTSFLYDVNGNTVKTTQTDGTNTLVNRIVYDENDQVIQIIDTDQYVAADDGLQPNADGICQTNTYLNSNVGDRYTYDDAGNVTTYINKANNQTVNLYDSENRLVKTTTYESAANQTNGLTTRYVYDVDGNLIQVVYPHQYNPAEDLLDVANHQNQYGSQTVGDRAEYDENGNITSFINSFGEEVTCVYDENQHLVKTVQNNDVTRYVYDGGDNLLQVIYPDQYTASDDLLDLDATPPVDQYADDSVGDRYTYDENGNVLTYVNRYDQTTTNTYDENGTLTSVTKPNNSVFNGNSVFCFDEKGRVTTETYPGDFQNSYEYLESQNRTTVTGSNGISTVYQANGLGQITGYTIQNENTNTNKAFSYTYDSNGNIATVSLNNQLLQSFTYNASNELTRVNDAQNNKTTTYTYDFVGNILSKKDYAYTTGSLAGLTPTHQDTYTYNSQNQRTDLSYDANGNLLNVNGYALGWTGRRLTSATHAADATSLSFTYDQDGIRTSKTVNGTTTYYYKVDESNNVVEQYRMVAGSDRKYDLINIIYDSNGSPIYFVINRTGYYDYRYYYEKNLQGDIIGLLDENGASVVQYAYDEWGKLLSVTGTSTFTENIGNLNPLRYRGYYYDTETGLYYLQSRYYDPAQMRFISQDDPTCSNAQGQPLGSNLYAYCLNNPVNHSDPTGSISFSDACKIIRDASRPINPRVISGAQRNAIKTAISSAGKRVLTLMKCPLAEALFQHFIWKNGASLPAQTKSKMITAFKKSSKLTDAIKQQLKKCKSNFLKTFTVEFPNNKTERDLYYSFQKINIQIYGTKKSNGTWQVQVKIWDKYDFTQWRLISDGLSKANAANDLGHCMQILELGKVFYWTVSFYNTY